MLWEDFQVSSEKDACSHSDSLPESPVAVIQWPEGVPGDRSPGLRPPWLRKVRRPGPRGSAGPAWAAHISHSQMRSPGPTSLASDSLCSHFLAA